MVMVEALVRLARRGQLRLLGALTSAVGGYYRVAFLGAAVRAGVLSALADGPVPLERLASQLGIPAAAQDGLQAWLDFGVRAGQLRLTAAGYALRGVLARGLALATNDAAAAMVDEVAHLHHRLITEAPELLAAGRRLTLADQSGALVARSSRILEPFVASAVDAVVPREGAMRLLEIGAGSGTHLRRALDRNPAMVAVGLELQPDVAAEARRNLRAWGLEARATIEADDVRARRPDALFDLATLHNNIYYFPVGERVALLRHVRGFLRAGGRLLITTGCRGGSPAVEILSLWGALTAGCGPLPLPDEMLAQLREAGFVQAVARRLIPGERFYAFAATSPAPASATPGDG